uniref:Uncharacterized protein n=1 Tax=Anopheles maculatus TaxID=74869 RepID=A0A182SKA6_9DIPT
MTEVLPIPIIGHGEAAVGVAIAGASAIGIGGGGGSGGVADGRDGSASKIRLKAGKARQGSVEDGCKIMIDIKSSPDYLNRSSGGSFDSSYKSSWGSHSSSQSQGTVCF